MSPVARQCDRSKRRVESPSVQVVVIQLQSAEVGKVVRTDTCKLVEQVAQRSALEPPGRGPSSRTAGIPVPPSFPGSTSNAASSPRALRGLSDNHLECAPGGPAFVFVRPRIREMSEQRIQNGRRRRRRATVFDRSCSIYSMSWPELKGVVSSTGRVPDGNDASSFRSTSSSTA